MSVPDQFGPPPQQSGGGGSTWLMILLIIALVLVLGCAGLCGGCLIVARRAGTSVQQGLREGIQLAQLSPAFVEAEQFAQNDPQVVERLGEPIEMVSQPKRQATGDLNPRGETFQFDIKGPKGTGIVSAVATAPAEPYSPFSATKVTVTFDDGSVVEVPLGDSAPPPAAEREPQP